MPGERDSPEQQLLYGRVTADARPPAGQPLHRVPLEVREAAEAIGFKTENVQNLSMIGNSAPSFNKCPSDVPLALRHPGQILYVCKPE